MIRAYIDSARLALNTAAAAAAGPAALAWYDGVDSYDAALQAAAALPDPAAALQAARAVYNRITQDGKAPYGVIAKAGQESIRVKTLLDSLADTALPAAR